MRWMAFRIGLLWNGFPMCPTILSCFRFKNQKCAYTLCSARPLWTVCVGWDAPKSRCCGPLGTKGYFKVRLFVDLYGGGWRFVGAVRWKCRYGCISWGSIQRCCCRISYPEKKSRVVVRIAACCVLHASAPFYASCRCSFPIFFRMYIPVVQSNNQVVCSSLGVILSTVTEIKKEIIAQCVEEGAIKGFSIGIIHGRWFSVESRSCWRMASSSKPRPAWRFWGSVRENVSEGSEDYDHEMWSFNFVSLYLSLYLALLRVQVPDITILASVSCQFCHWWRIQRKDTVIESFRLSTDSMDNEMPNMCPCVTF